MIRVLQIVESLGVGGIQSFLMNIYRSINRDEIQFDFLLQRRFYNDFEKEVLDRGGKLFVLPSRREGILKSRRALSDFFDEHPEYKAVHMHISSLTYVDPLVIAKKKGVPIRIVHSHSTKAPGRKIHTLLHLLNKNRIGRLATDLFACSDLAADWFYGGTKWRENATVLANGIDCSKYKFDAEIRAQYRKQYGWENKTVFGHVGRIHSVKNHKYLVQIFEAYLKVNTESMLVIVGDGELRQSIEEQVKEMGIENNVCFLGNRTDVAQLFQAFDLFLLPSYYEGFPVTLVEAQTAGLYCVASDTITPTSNLADAVTFCSITQSPEKWIVPMKEALDKKRNVMADDKIRKAGFDVKDVADNLCLKYCENT